MEEYLLKLATRFFEAFSGKLDNSRGGRLCHGQPDDDVRPYGASSYAWEVTSKTHLVEWRLSFASD